MITYCTLCGRHVVIEMYPTSSEIICEEEKKNLSNKRMCQFFNQEALKMKKNLYDMTSNFKIERLSSYLNLFKLITR